MSQDKYCSCPYCKAIFRLPHDKYRYKKAGIVRCGSCREVFDCSQNLVIWSEESFIPVSILSNYSDDLILAQADTNSIESSPEFSDFGLLNKDDPVFDSINPEDESFTTESLFSISSLWNDNGNSQDSVQNVKNPFEDTFKGSPKTISGSIDGTRSEPVFSPCDLGQESKQLDSVSLSIDSDFPGPGRKRKETSLNRMSRNHVDAYLTDQKSPISTGVWIAVAVGFVFLLGVQVKYFFIEKYAQDTLLRPYLSIFCSLANCELPPRKNSFKFTLTHTKIDLHPNQPGAVRVIIKLINEAGFAQPYPDLQLTLTDRVGRVVGRRTFSPELYLKENPDRMIGDGELASVLFNLIRPHEKAVGFEIDIVTAS